MKPLSLLFGFLLCFGMANAAYANYTAFNHTSSVSGENVTFTVNWNIDGALSFVTARFEIDNGNGTLQNYTISNTACGGGSCIEVYTYYFVLNSTANSTIRWRQYVNNSIVFNASPQVIFNTQQATGTYNVTAYDETALPASSRLFYNLTSTNLTTSRTVNNASLMSIENLTSGSATLEFTGTNLYARKLFYDITRTTSINRSIYLIPLSYGYAVTLSISVLDVNGQPVENALVNLQKTINNENLILDQEYSVTGVATFTVDCRTSATYYINVTSASGNAYAGVPLSCTSSNEYAIVLNQNLVYPLIPNPYENVSYSLYPRIKIYDNYTLFNLTFYTNLGYNNFQYFNLTVTYWNGTVLYAQNKTGFGSITYNFSKRDFIGNLSFRITHKTSDMAAEYYTTELRYISQASNNSVPAGLEFPKVQQSFPAFVYLFVPFIIAIGITSFLASAGLATSGGLAVVFSLTLLPFALWGWINMTLWGFFFFLSIALTLLFQQRF